MKLSADAYKIIVALYKANRSLAEGTDDQRRQLTKMIAEQLAFSIDRNFGTKASAKGHPQSKDAIAYLASPRLFCWDWQNGNSRAPQVHVGSEAEDITGQLFIEVTPVDHLAVSEPTPAPKPEPNIEPRVAKLEKQLAALLAKLKEGIPVSRELFHSHLLKLDDEI